MPKKRFSPEQNGYCESFNGKLRDELLNGEIFYSLKEVKIVIEQWRKHYNTVRPHPLLGYRPAAQVRMEAGLRLPQKKPLVLEIDQRLGRSRKG
jgi:transposase InsO family protein